MAIDLKILGIRLGGLMIKRSTSASLNGKVKAMEYFWPSGTEHLDYQKKKKKLLLLDEIYNRMTEF